MGNTLINVLAEGFAYDKIDTTRVCIVNGVPQKESEIRKKLALWNIWFPCLKFIEHSWSHHLVSLA